MKHAGGAAFVKELEEVFAQIAFHASHGNGAGHFALFVHGQAGAGRARRGMLDANQNGLRAFDPGGIPCLNGLHCFFHEGHDTQPAIPLKAQNLREEDGFAFGQESHFLFPGSLPTMFP